MLKKVRGILVFVMIPVVLYIVFSFAADGFGPQSLRVIFNQTLIPLVIGYGMTFTLAGGLWDLSAGGQIVLAGVVGGLLSESMGIPGLLIGCIATTLLASTLTGMIYRFAKIPSMVVSIGMIMIFEVFARFLAGANSFVSISDGIASVGSGVGSYIMVLIISVVFYLLYYHTKFSCHIKAIGNDEVIAANMGIKVDKIKVLSFIIGGLFFGVAAVLQICYSGTMSTQINMNTMLIVFKPMMGVLIGLQLLSVLDNMVISVFVGEFAISMIFTGLIAIGLPAAIQDVFLGVFMIVVIGISENILRVNDMVRKLTAKKRMKREKAQSN